MDILESFLNKQTKTKNGRNKPDKKNQSTFSSRLSQSSKVLAKRELLKVPLVGWTWYFLEIVFCKRKWEEDRETVFKGLNQLKDYPEYMWVSVFKKLDCNPQAIG